MRKKKLHQAVSEQKLGQIHALADEVNRLMDSIDETESQLEDLKTRKYEIESELLPDLIAETGVQDFEHGGSKFKLGYFVSGSFPKGEQGKRAYKWLEKYGLGHLLKIQLTVNFPREKPKKPRKLHSFSSKFATQS